MAKFWTVEMCGGLQRVFCSVEVAAETAEDAKRLAKQKALENGDWEMGYGQRVFADDIDIQNCEEI